MRSPLGSALCCDDAVVSETSTVRTAWPMAFLEPTSTTSFDVRARRDYWSGHQQTSEEGAVGVADHRGLNGETGLLETQSAVRQGKTMPSTPSPWRRTGPDPNRLHSAAVSSASPTSSLSRAMAPATSGGSGSCGSASIPTTVSTPCVCERPRQPGIRCSASGCPQRLVAIPASCAHRAPPPPEGHRVRAARAASSVAPSESLDVVSPPPG
ncbi:MAG: hypothetical protein QOH09_2803 [Pseudonocardiales bacterium]|nr:hypothetical protein [Pseudonocardiales bacterium]